MFSRTVLSSSKNIFSKVHNLRCFHCLRIPFFRLAYPKHAKCSDRLWDITHCNWEILPYMFPSSPTPRLQWQPSPHHVAHMSEKTPLREIISILLIVILENLEHLHKNGLVSRKNTEPSVLCTALSIKMVNTFNMIFNGLLCPLILVEYIVVPDLCVFIHPSNSGTIQYVIDSALYLVSVSVLSLYIDYTNKQIYLGFHLCIIPLR